MHDSTEIGTVPRSHLNYTLNVTINQRKLVNSVSYKNKSHSVDNKKGQWHKIEGEC